MQINMLAIGNQLSSGDSDKLVLEKQYQSLSWNLKGNMNSTYNTEIRKQDMTNNKKCS